MSDGKAVVGSAGTYLFKVGKCGRLGVYFNTPLHMLDTTNTENILIIENAEDYSESVITECDEFDHSKLHITFIQEAAEACVVESTDREEFLEKFMSTVSLAVGSIESVTEFDKKGFEKVCIIIEDTIEFGLVFNRWENKDFEFPKDKFVIFVDECYSSYGTANVSEMISEDAVSIYNPTDGNNGVCAEVTTVLLETFERSKDRKDFVEKYKEALRVNYDTYVYTPPKAEEHYDGEEGLENDN